MKQTVFALIAWLCAAPLMAQKATDLTSRITNADFKNGTTGWTTYLKNRPSYTQTWNTLTGATPATVETFAGMGNWELDAFRITQQVTLEPGTYRFSSNSFYRWGSTYNSDVNNSDKKGARSMAYIVAGSDSVLVPRLGDPQLPELRPAAYANAMYEASAAFAAGLYKTSIVFTVTEQKAVTLGFSGRHDRDWSWFITGPVKLERISDEVLEAEAAAEIAAARTEYATLKEFFNKVVAEHESDTPFDPAKADAMLAEATDLAAVQLATDTLSEAFGRFLKTCNELVDFTPLITNPGFETGTLEGWDCLHYGDQNLVARTDNGIYSFAGTKGTYLFNTWRSGDGTNENHFIFQTLKHLPPGSYQLHAVLAGNQSDAELTLRANDKTVAVKCSDKGVGVPAELSFALTKTAGVRIGVASNRWFKVDDFHLYYANEVYLLRADAQEAIRNFETLGSQAAPGEGHDEFVSLMAQLKAELKEAYTKTAATLLKNRARTAAVKLIENTPAKAGLYDISVFITNPSLAESTTGWTASATPGYGYDVAEVYNNTGAFTLTQTLGNMPAGNYQLVMQGFHRTKSFTEALADYQGGTIKTKATLKLATATQTIKNIFDEPRFNTSSGSFNFSPMPEGSGVPGNLDKTNQLFIRGHYWNTVRAERPKAGSLAIGVSNPSGSAANNWLTMDNVHLFYGKDYAVNLDTMTTVPLPVYADVHSTRTLHAGGLNAVCLPYQTSLSDFEAVYEVAEINADGAMLVPARSMKVGRTYLVAVDADRTLEASDVLLSAMLPDSVPALWNGAHTVGAPYARKAPAGAYRLNAAGTALEKVPTGTPILPCEPLFYLPADMKNAPAALGISTKENWQQMDMVVNLENEKVRQYLAAASYPSSTSSSIVERYNTMDPVRRDHPRNVLVPIPLQEKRPTTQRFVYSTDPDFADYTRVNMTRGGTEFYLNNLIPGTTYYYKVEAGSNIVTKGTIHADGQLRMIYTSHGSNIRDMGGWLTESGHRLRYGRIYRGGEMHVGYQTTLTDDDIKELQRLGIGAEMDLREDGELNGGVVDYSALGKTAPYIYVNQHFQENINNTSAQATNLIVDTLKYRDLFNFLAEQCKAGRATYYHCIWGADRTGAFGVLLTGLLGLSRSDICKDYELTTFSKAGTRNKIGIETKLAYINTFPGATLQERFYAYLNTYVGVPKENLDAIIQYMVNTDADGIGGLAEQPNTIMPATAPAAIYDLQGRKVAADGTRSANLPRGIYITNGHKVAK